MFSENRSARRLAMALTLLTGTAASAQQNMDISFMGGLSQSARASISGTTIQATTGVGPSFEVNYGYQVLRRDAVELWIETPMVFGNAGSSATVSPGVVSASNNSLFALTPGLRVRIPTQSRLSVFAAGGFGYGSFAHLETLVEPSLVETQSTFSTHLAFDAGGGVDVRLTRLVSLRAEVRDFIGVGSVASLDRRNHVFYELGIALHF
jgi:opacity protein-like surface antigen